MAEDFANIAAVVTGGASGIGLAVATLMRANGASVVVLDLQPPPEGTGHLWIQVDITDDDSVRRAIDAANRQIPGVDVLVNSAGISAVGSVADNPDEEWLRVLDVNVMGAVRVTRACLPSLRRSPAAAVVNVCSVAATAGLPQRAVYSASKGALLALTLAMAADHVGEGIRVNAVNPGTAATPWVDRLLAQDPDPGSARRALELRQPIGRLVTADEVAHAVCYLASPQSGSTTGTALAVDGGMAGLRLPARR